MARSKTVRDNFEVERMKKKIVVRVDVELF
jgi:hypothetical protein